MSAGMKRKFVQSDLSSKFAKIKVTALDSQRVQDTLFPVTLAVASLFGKSYNRFTLPTKIELSIARGKLGKRKLDALNELKHFSSIIDRSQQDYASLDSKLLAEYKDAIDIVESIKRTLKNLDAMGDEIDSITGQAAAQRQGKGRFT
jgi:hypothetical protein